VVAKDGVETKGSRKESKGDVRDRRMESPNRRSSIITLDID